MRLFRTWLKVRNPSEAFSFFFWIHANRDTDDITAEIADPKHNEPKSDEPNSTDSTTRPSRKVAQPPGGETTIGFAEYEHTDALSTAPPRFGSDNKANDQEEVEYTSTDKFSAGEARVDQNSVWTSSGDQFRPTRKVRESECNGRNGY